MIATRGHLLVDGDGGTTWHSDTPAAVARVRVVHPDGAAFEVDAGDPGRLLAVTLSPMSSKDRAGLLADLVPDPIWVQGFVAAVDQGGGQRQFEGPPRLGADWSRVAEVEALNRWMLQPVDDALLTVDRGLSWYDAGLPDEAAPLLRRSSATLVELAERTLAGDLPAAAWDSVRHAVTVAASLLDAEDLDQPELARLAEEFQEEPPEHSPGRSTDDARANYEPMYMGADSQTSGTVHAISGHVDPALVPPRVLAWRGAQEPELVGSHIEGSAGVEVSVNLADAALAEDREATMIVAYAALAATGEPWSSVALASDSSGRVLTGVIPVHGHDVQGLVFGVRRLGTQEPLRADLLGRQLAQVDRLMIDSWNVARLASTARYGGAARDLRWSQETAVRLAATALERLGDAILDVEARRRAALRSGAKPSSPVPEWQLDAVKRRRRAVLARLDELERPPGIRAHREPPTFAELLLVLDGPSPAT